MLTTWLEIFISVEIASARWLHVKTAPARSWLLPWEVSLTGKQCGENPVPQPLLMWVIVSHLTSPSSNSSVTQVRLLYVRAAAADWSTLWLCSPLQQQNGRVFFSVLQKPLPRGSLQRCGQCRALEEDWKIWPVFSFMLIALTQGVTRHKRPCWLYALLGDTLPCIFESVYLIFQAFIHEY